MARTTTLTWAQYSALWDSWTSDFLRSGHSLQIDGRPVAAFNNLADFVARYGRATFAIMLEYGARRAEVTLGVRPYLLGVIGQADLRNVRLADQLPVDGITGYGLLPNWLGPTVQNYPALITQRVADWEQMQRRLDKPFYPVVCVGWDASVRGNPQVTTASAAGYPYSPVVTGVTPELFGSFIDQALSFNSRWRPRDDIVFLHAWNEWTESSALEPSDRFGTMFLEQVRRRSSVVASLRKLTTINYPRQ